MRNLILLVLIGMMISFSSCEKQNESIPENPTKYPSIKVVNQNRSQRVITSFRLVGYEFKNLNIGVGESQTFILDQGMSGGYSDIYTTVFYNYGGYPTRYVSTKVNFNGGETSTISLSGCTGAEGCNGLYLQ